MAGGVAGRRDHLHGDVTQPYGFAADEVTGRLSRPEMELIPEERFPEQPFLFGESIPFEEDRDIGKRRRIAGRDPEGKVVEEVEVHEMVLVPVAEPDHLHLLFGTQTDQPFPVRGRIDEDAGAFDVEGVTEGITSPVVAGEKTDRTECLLFHGDTEKRKAIKVAHAL